jgi:hypothetical protein
MKIFLISLGTFLFTLNTYGQTGKGTSLIGGNMFFNSQNNFYEFSVNPNYGYFFGNSFCMGLFSEFSTNKFDVDDIHNNSISLGPLFRYFLNSGKVRIFTEIKPSYGWYSTNYQDTYSASSKTKGSFYKLKHGVGLSCVIISNVSIETMISYYWMNTISEISNGSFHQDFNYNDHGVSFVFGFQIYLQHKD